MKKNILFILMSALIVSVGFTSCLKDNDENENNSYLYSFFTAEGSYPNYKLISDDGVVVYPTAESVQKATKGKGFGDSKRMILSVEFKNIDLITDVETKTTTIKNAVILDGRLLKSVNPLDDEAATAQGITVADSLFDTKSIDQYWGCVTGYLTAIVSSEYDINKNGKPVEPSFNIVYNQNDIKENAVDVTLCNNQHRSKENNSAHIAKFTTSFSMKELLERVPGKDSITVTINGKGLKTYEIKFSRNLR